LSWLQDAVYYGRQPLIYIHSEGDHHPSKHFSSFLNYLPSIAITKPSCL